jgi:hypothetical protein
MQLELPEIVPQNLDLILLYECVCSTMMVYIENEPDMYGKRIVY